MGSTKKDPGIEKDENLVAVVMTDDFEEKFAILTEDRPKCLLTLANKEMIDYTLEFLQSSNVQDCYVYCAKYIPQIKRHLSAKQWLSTSSTEQQTKRNKMNVSVIPNENCHSFGDAMRDLDNKGILKDHFILTSADLISNANLEPYIQEHRRRYQENKNTTLSLVYKHADPGHQSRSKDQEILLLTKNESNRIVYHERAKSAFKEKSEDSNEVQFPTEIFQANTNDEISIRYDLVDTGIAICAPSVPLQFAERFDCQTLDEFIKGSIEDDIADHFMYASVIGDTGNGSVCNGYAAKITDFLTYLSVTTDILNRWAYPQVPEGSRTSIGKKLYTMSRHNVYKAANVTLMVGSVLQEDVIVGENTIIGENSILCNASLGNNCKLKANVSIRDSVIHDNAIIGDNCQIQGSIIGQDVVIGSNVVIHDKCVIGPGVHIKENCKPIESLTWIVSKKVEDEFGDDPDSDETEESVFGPKAFLYRLQGDADESDSEDEEEQNSSSPACLEDAWGLLNLSENECEDSASSWTDDEDHEFEEGDDFAGLDIINDPDARFLQFHDEVIESLQRGYEENTEDGNLVLEVNASRHAYAMTATQVVRSVIMSVFAIAKLDADRNDSSSNTFLKEVKSKLNFFKGLIQRYVKSEPSQIDCMHALEMYCWRDETFLNIASKTVHFMYDGIELLSEDAILDWYDNVEDDEVQTSSANRSISTMLRERLNSLIEWLNEDSDEED